MFRDQTTYSESHSNTQEKVETAPPPSSKTHTEISVPLTTAFSYLHVTTLNFSGLITTSSFFSVTTRISQTLRHSSATYNRIYHALLQCVTSCLSKQAQSLASINLLKCILLHTTLNMLPLVGTKVALHKQFLSPKLTVFTTFSKAPF